MLSYLSMAACLVSLWAAGLAFSDARRFRSATAAALAWLCLQSALWAGSWVVAYATEDVSLWWVSFRWATTGYGFLGTPGLLAVLLFVGLPGRKAVVTALPVFLYELVVVIHGWQAPLFATGFVATPAGNALVHNVSSAWYWADAGLYLPQLGALGLLAAQGLGGGPRVRKQAWGLFAGFLVGNSLTVAGSVVVPLLVPGFPSVGVLAGAVAPLFFVVVLRGHRLAAPDDPRILKHLIEGLDEPVALLGPLGELRRVNLAWVDRGGPGVGKNLFDEIRAATNVEELWKEATRTGKACPELLCSLQGRRVFLSLTPVVDNFRDLVGAVAVLRRPGVFEAFAEAHGLSDRESEVASLVLQGRTNRQIAEGLGLTETTVKTYVRRVFDKSGVTHRLELFRRVFASQP